jgi:drug/metabolite transporter (DMT)-like permease
MKIIIWLTLCLIWGTTWFFIKIGLEDLPPITFAAARFAFAISILAVIIVAQKIPLPATKREWKLIALTGVLQFSVNYSLVFWSEQHISSGLAAVLQAMITVFGLALAWVHLPDERITRLKIIAVLLGIGGVAVILVEQLQINSLMAFAGLRGDCLRRIRGGARFDSGQSLRRRDSSGDARFRQMICGIAPVIIYGLAVEGNPLRLNWNWRAIICVLYLSVFGTVAAFWLYYWLLSKLESTKAMMISLVTPLIAVIIGGIFLGERLPVQTFFGGVLILASIGLIVFRKKISRSGHAEKENFAANAAN